MVVEYVRYTIPEERREVFERAYAEAARSLDASPDCVAYELAHCMEDLASYVLRIEWTSYDGHMLGFRRSGEFQTFLRAVQPYTSNIAEMRHYALTDISRRSLLTASAVDRDAHPSASESSRNGVPTLFEWAGGLPAFERLTAVFYSRVREDALLAPVFAKMVPEHARYVALFIAEVFGGPALYTAERGGHRTMVSRHLGRRLTPVQRRRWVDLLQECADEAGLPDDPEFRSAFVAYLEWGSRLALMNSQEDEPTSNLDQPVPKWGWGERPAASDTP